MKRFGLYGALLLALVMVLPLHGCKQPAGLSGLFQPKAKSAQSSQVTETARVEASVPARQILGCDMDSLSKKERDMANPAWERIWAVCPASSVAGYNYVLTLMKKGDTPQAAEVAAGAASLHPDFEPLQELSLRLNNPYGYVGTLADQKLQVWLAAKSRHSFTRTPPTKRTPPPLPKLVKGEFETSGEFTARVEKAKQQRLAQLQKIERDYEAEVKVFNDAVAAHNRAVESEARQRAAAIPAMRTKFLEGAMADVFGTPQLTDPVYDADSGKFHARLVSSNGLISEKVTVAVPRGEARNFKEQAARVKVAVPYDFKNGKLVRGTPQMSLAGRTYAGVFTDETFTPVVMTAMADVKMQPGTTISTMKADKLDMSSVRTEDAAYFGGALKAQDDPQLAALEQERAENARKLKEGRLQAARDAEAARIREQIKKQEQELASMGGSAGKDYKGLKEKRHWKFAAARTPARDTVAVVIGNRAYQKGIPLVHYAYNDAKAMRQFLTTTLGVPQENILYRQDATKGEMEGLFKGTLPNRVESGKTDVIVYFSGHGMPVDSRALLLPTDARPDTAQITGYSRDTMLAQLDALHAKSVTVILDACFSGTAKDGDPLTQGKPVYKKPEGAILPGNTVLISASRSNQISRMDDQAGMSLMTLYLLEGLSGKADANGDGTVSVAELKIYLEKNVSKAARLTFDSDQQPEVLGPEARALVAY